jgi:hypothetical protein
MLTAANSALKIYYHKRLADITTQVEKSVVTPFFSRLTKGKGKVIENAYGESFVIKLRSQLGAGVTADYNASYTKVTGGATGAYSDYKSFVIPVAKKYNHAGVEGLAMIQSETPAQAFAKMGQKELDGALVATMRQLATLAAGGGYGILGTISAANASPPYIDLTVKSEAANFRKGMDLVGMASASSGALRSATARTVTSIDPSLGRIFLSADPTALAWAANDVVAVNGDRPNSPSIVNLLGLDFWIPTALPAVGSGVDATGVERSTTELAGHRYDCLGASIVDGVIDASAYGANYDLSPDIILGNPFDVAKIAKAQEDKRSIPVKGKSVDVSWDAIAVNTAWGVLPMLADRTIKEGRLYFLDSSTWLLPYVGDDIVHPISEGNGNIFHKVLTADQWIAAVRAAFNIACDWPGGNLVVTNFV